MPEKTVQSIASPCFNCNIIEFIKCHTNPATGVLSDSVCLGCGFRVMGAEHPTLKNAIRMLNQVDEHDAKYCPKKWITQKALNSGIKEEL